MDECKYRTRKQIPYHKNKGFWGTMYDDDIAYRDVDICYTIGHRCETEIRDDCITYHSLELTRLFTKLTQGKNLNKTGNQ